MAGNEFGRAIPESVFARKHREVFQMAPDVLRELVNRRVAALGLFPQRHKHNVVEVPVEALTEFFVRPFADCAEI
jgi:hypothetical protein